jgi:hypothetical protein
MADPFGGLDPPTRPSKASQRLQVQAAFEGRLDVLGPERGTDRLFETTFVFLAILALIQGPSFLGPEGRRDPRAFFRHDAHPLPPPAETSGLA